MKKYIALFLSLCLGALFILSAYSKLFPIEPFEYNIVGTTFIGWKSSVLVARLIIGLEFFLGILLLFSYHHKNTIPAAAIMIGIFSIHLTYQLISKGNSGDCGCFGNMLSMTPLQGLLKNLGILAILAVIYKLGFNFTLKLKNIEFYLLILSVGAIFMVNPVDFGHAESYLNKPFEHYTLEIDTLYNSYDNPSIQHPTHEIRKGKYIAAFLSSTCGHCKIAAQKFSVMHQENPGIPIYFFINGEEDKIKSFRSRTATENIPFSKLNGPLFVELAGLQLPIIYYLNNSVVEKQVDYFTLDQDHIENWLKK